MYESHKSRYMEALLNNTSHYGEMFKTAHHLFSGGSVKVYTAFQCFLWVTVQFCRMQHSGGNVYNGATLQLSVVFSWCGPPWTRAETQEGWPPGYTWTLTIGSCCTWFWNMLLPAYSSPILKPPPTGVPRGINIFWEPCGGCRDDRDGQVLLSSCVSPGYSLFCLNSKDINDVSLVSKLPFSKNPSHLIVLCYLEDLSLFFLQGLPNQEIWSPGVFFCVFTAPITFYANRMGGAYQGATDGLMDWIDGFQFSSVGWMNWWMDGT